MNVGPFDIQCVIDRLVETPELFRGVEGAAEYEAAELQGATSTPWAFVLVAGDQAKPHSGASSGLLVQSAQALVGVVIATRNYRRADLGKAAGADATSLVRRTRCRLLGWVPPGARDPIDLHSGRLMKQGGGFMWWQDVYRVNFRIEVRT